MSERSGPGRISEEMTMTATMTMMRTTKEKEKVVFLPSEKEPYSSLTSRRTRGDAVLEG